MFGDELSQTRIYYVICLTYKFCLRSKSEREKRQSPLFLLLLLFFQQTIKALFPFSAKATDDTFGPGSASFRYKQKALAFKMK